MPTLFLSSPPFCPGDDQANLFSALLRCPAASGMPKTENLLFLASVRPRDIGLPLVHPLVASLVYRVRPGFHGFPQPDTHKGLHGKRAAILLCLPAQSTRTLAELWWERVCSHSLYFPKPTDLQCLVPGHRKRGHQISWDWSYSFKLPLFQAGSYSLDQAGLELRDLPASAVLG